MRPTEPTTTGTATSSDCAAKLSPSRSLMPGPSGLSSAHAQKLTMNPAVARTRLAVAARLVTTGGCVAGRMVAAAGSVLGVFIVVMANLGGAGCQRVRLVGDSQPGRLGRRPRPVSRPRYTT